MFLTMDLIDIIKRFQIILMDHPERSYQEKKDLADTTLQPWMWTGEMLFIFMVSLHITCFLVAISILITISVDPWRQRRYLADMGAISQY